MALKSKLRSLKAAFIPLASALLLAALVAIPSSGIALAQVPPGDEITLVNADRDFVGAQEAAASSSPAPSSPARLETLFYAVRDADTGDWISGHVPGHRRREGERRRLGVLVGVSRPLDEQPDLDPDRAYLLVMLAGTPRTGCRSDFYAVVPIHQPGKHLGQDSVRPQPRSRWARAFAGWMIEGVHGTLCGVVERASGEDADNCGGVDSAMSDIITGTPADLTYAHDHGAARRGWSSGPSPRARWWSSSAGWD